MFIKMAADCLFLLPSQMEPLIRSSTLRLAAKIAKFSDKREKVDVLKYEELSQTSLPIL